MLLPFIVLLTEGMTGYADAAINSDGARADESYELAPQYFFETGESRVAFRDSGGNNPAVLLLHPFTGSANSWQKQYGSLIEGGYRVVALNARGAGASGSLPAPGHDDSGDIGALLTHLGLSEVAVVGAAAGGIMALRFAVDHPDSVGALVLSNSFAGLQPAELIKLSEKFLPDSGLPAHFKELGPSYRYTALSGADDEGLERWDAIYRSSRSAKMAVLESSQRAAWRKSILQNLVTETEISGVRQDVLLIYGGADLLMPPPIGMSVRNRFHNAALAIIPGSGHAAHWEFPERFNAVLLEFLESHFVRDSK